MLSNFSNENIEKFLKQSADQLRMRPSDNVWLKIERRMQRRRRRVVFTSALFLLTASIFGYYLIDSSQSLHEPLPPVPMMQLPAAHQPEATPAPTATNRSTGTRLTSKPAAKHPVRHIPLADEPAASQQLPAEADTTSHQWAIAAFTPTVVDAYKPKLPVPAPATQENVTSDLKKGNIPANESVVNSYKPQHKKKKTEFQLFITPTISYRKLSENKSYLRSVPSNSITFNNAFRYNVNNVVTHKPALGLEVGFAFKYPLAKSISLRSGLQFNVNRYDIKAFNYVPVVATIALNRGSGGIDSLNTITRYRNINSRHYDNWLENMYFQVSAPVGLDFKLRGDERTQLGIATTIQPTYVLGERAYLISSDYKNYSKVPSLTRRWNVNTALEAYVGYTTGRVKWQVGPQIRYQLLSSFDSQYPVKENLFDFGLKIGISLNKQ